MDAELKEQLQVMNENLKSIAANQALIYTELMEIEGRIVEPDKKAG